MILCADGCELESAHFSSVNLRLDQWEGKNEKKKKNKKKKTRRKKKQKKKDKCKNDNKRKKTRKSRSGRDFANERNEVL